MEENKMKKFLALLLAVLMVVGMFAACGNKPADNDDANATITDPEKVADEMTSADGKYEIAFITDVGSLKDKSFNQGTYDGVKLYAANNNKTYKYYMPANGNQATDDDRINAVKAACDNGAKVVVAAGFMQEGALRAAAKQYTDVSFIFIDGYPVAEEAGVDGSPVLKNIAGISFQEEQSGFLAGYATVMEGYTKLGFTGGGGGTNPACQRFGYGFAQGAEAAAAAKGVKVELNYSWLHGATFSASNELQTMAIGWYQNGTEVIFACGGSMFTSVSAAAGAEDGKVVGVDVDQSSQSPTVITSAMKGLADSVQWALAKFYEGKFAEIGGTGTALGAKDNAVGLPTATWSLKNWKVADYEALLAKIKDGSVAVKADLVEFPESTANVTVNAVK
ncbi:MAG: BMP family ABC transporter substrate-binding protein [Oscillospiraceae bacterium]|nr:BMP family ABC transporter substrate-binding protein [Oscillospiraceae bacterium]